MNPEPMDGRGLKSLKWALNITIPAFTPFDAKDQRKPDDKLSIIMQHSPEQLDKCPEGQATEGSAA